MNREWIVRYTFLEHKTNRENPVRTAGHVTVDSLEDAEKVIGDLSRQYATLRAAIEWVPSKGVRRAQGRPAGVVR